MRWPWKKKRRTILEEIHRYRRWPRRLKFHREGVWLLIMIFGLGIAATNTGHNLLYLLLGFLLSLIILSGVLSERVLKKAKVEFEVPVGLFAHEAVRIPTWIGNERRRGRIYSLRTVPMLEPDLVETVPAYAPEIEPTVKQRHILRMKFCAGAYIRPRWPESRPTSPSGWCARAGFTLPGLLPGLASDPPGSDQPGEQQQSGRAAARHAPVALRGGVLRDPRVPTGRILPSGSTGSTPRDWGGPLSVNLSVPEHPR